MKARALPALVAALLLPVTGAWAREHVFNLSECLQHALLNNGEVLSAAGGVKGAEGQLAWAEGLAYPKLDLFSFLTVDGKRVGDASSYSRDWGTWGPYFSLKATLMQPLFTWGMIANAKKATALALEVEREKVRLAKQCLALEIKQTYYGYLYLQRMKQVLKFGRENLAKALDYARTEFNKASGTISRPDLSRLELGMAEIDKYQLEVEKNDALALDLLKLKLGLAKDDTVVIREKALALDETPVGDLAACVETAFQNRPEWRQLRDGIDARRAQVEIARGERLPLFFAGAVADLGWSPQSQRQTSGFLSDPYNARSVGAAVGFKWTLDFWSAAGKVKQAEAEVDKLVAKRPFYEDGLRLQVKEAWHEVAKQKKLLAGLEESVKVAQKWMLFGMAGYNTGTAESKDVLEGLASYVMKRKEYYEAVMNCNLALARLSLVTGKELSKGLSYQE